MVILARAVHEELKYIRGRTGMRPAHPRKTEAGRLGDGLSQQIYCAGTIGDQRHEMAEDNFMALIFFCQCRNNTTVKTTVTMRQWSVTKVLMSIVVNREYGAIGGAVLLGNRPS